MGAREDRNERYLAPPDLLKDLGRRTAKGGIISGGGQAIRIALQIVGTAVLARLLDPGDFGLVAMATTVTIFVAVFTDLGLSGVTVQSREISQKLVSTLLVINVGVGALLWLCACLVAPLAGWFYGDFRVTWLIIGVALAIPLTAAGAQHNALLIRTMQWMKIQTVATLSQLIGFLIAVTLLLTTSIGYWALVVQQVSSAFIGLALNWILCSWRPALPLDFQSVRSGLSFGGYLTGFSVINYFYRQADNVLIGWRWGERELGFYSRAYNLITLPISMVNQTISSVAVTALSRLQHDEAAWNSAFLRLITIANIAGAGLCAILFACAEPLILLLLGETWKPVVPIFQILAVSSTIATGSNGSSWVFISKGETRKLFQWAVWAVPVYVIAYFIGLPWGAQGVAIGYAITMVLLGPVYLIFALRSTSISLGHVAGMLLPFHGLAAIAGLVGWKIAGLLGQSPYIVGLFCSAGSACTLYALSALALVLTLPVYRPLRDSLLNMLPRPLRTLGR